MTSTNLNIRLNVKKVSKKTHVFISLFPHRCMARVLERNPLHFGDVAKEGNVEGVLRHVVSAIDQKCWWMDKVQAVNSSPRRNLPAKPGEKVN